MWLLHKWALGPDQPCLDLSSEFTECVILGTLATLSVPSSFIHLLSSFLPPFLFLRFYWFIFRERGREGETGRETSMCGCLSCIPQWGPGPQPRHVSWLGIEPVTLWFFAGQHSVHWATPARALKKKDLFLERRKGREKKRERNIDWLPLTCPQPGTWPTTRHVPWPGIKAVTFLLVCRTTPNPLSHTSQGGTTFLYL